MFTRNEAGWAAIPALAALFIALISLSAPATATADTITVPLDKSRLVRLSEPAADVVVGNPSIADVSVENARLLVVTGKSFGSTNLIVLGPEGKQILSSNLSVLDPGAGFVTVHAGAKMPQSYYCVPRCTSPMAIGDDVGYFKSIQKEVSDKQKLGQTNATSGVGSTR